MNNKSRSGRLDELKTRIIASENEYIQINCVTDR